jgi:aminopeptidase 2
MTWSSRPTLKDSSSKGTLRSSKQPSIDSNRKTRHNAHHDLQSLDVKEETNHIVFNAASLELDQATLQSEALKTEQIQITEQSFDEDLDRVTIKLASPLPANSKAKLRVPFKAPITGGMIGYYFSHTEIDGKKVYVT